MRSPVLADSFDISALLGRKAVLDLSKLDSLRQDEADMLICCSMPSLPSFMVPPPPEPWEFLPLDYAVDDVYPEICSDASDDVAGCSGHGTASGNGGGYAATIICAGLLALTVGIAVIVASVWLRRKRRRRSRESIKERLSLALYTEASTPSSYEYHHGPDNQEPRSFHKSPTTKQSAITLSLSPLQNWSHPSQDSFQSGSSRHHSRQQFRREPDCGFSSGLAKDPEHTYEQIRSHEDASTNPELEKRFGSACQVDSSLRPSCSRRRSGSHCSLSRQKRRFGIQHSSSTSKLHGNCWLSECCNEVNGHLKPSDCYIGGVLRPVLASGTSETDSNGILKIAATNREIAVPTPIAVDSTCACYYSHCYCDICRAGGRDSGYGSVSQESGSAATGSPADGALLDYAVGGIVEMNSRGMQPIVQPISRKKAKSSISIGVHASKNPRAESHGFIGSETCLYRTTFETARPACVRGPNCFGEIRDSTFV